jgi:hypothetical protein
MASKLLNRLLMHLEETQYARDAGKPVELTVILSNGVTLRGQIVNTREFASINARDEEPRDRGTFPKSFDNDLRTVGESPDMYIHFDRAEILINASWEPIGTMRVPTDIVVSWGDAH